MLSNQQRGFALFELVLAIALASLIGVWTATSWIKQVEDAAAQGTGIWLLTVKKAMDQMLSRQADAMTGIAPARAGAGDYADLWRPTVAELIAAGHLPAGFALKPPLTYDVAIRVFAPVGDCEQIGCRIDALIHAQPNHSARTGALDTNRLGMILNALEGAGASVHPLRSDRIRGALVDLPNPAFADMPQLLPGSIAVLSFYDSSTFAQFIRQDDKRDARLKGQLNVQQGITSESDIRSSAGLRAAGRISAGEFLHMNGVAQEATACDTEGLIGRNASGELLTCHQGRWLGGGSKFGGVFSIHGTYGCPKNLLDATLVNPLTGGCHCPPGFQSVEISRWKRAFVDIEEFRTYICIR